MDNSAWALIWRPYAEASAWVQEQGIRTEREWSARAQSPNWPSDIPKNPYEFYKDKGWMSWPAFFGTERIWRPYAEASAWVQEQGIRNEGELKARAKLPNWPSDIPKNPYQFYKDKGWVSWPAFFGNSKSRKANQK